MKEIYLVMNNTDNFIDSAYEKEFNAKTIVKNLCNARKNIKYSCHKILVNCDGATHDKLEMTVALNGVCNKERPSDKQLMKIYILQKNSNAPAFEGITRKEASSFIDLYQS